jgi:NAD(P)-dependent dehydrogenase (short-subunit alcohol dehydrogenase family)
MKAGSGESGGVEVAEPVIVIVTGAAGGIGRATTRLLSEAGYGVVGLDINPEVEELTCMSSQVPVLGLVADHECLASVEAAVSAADELGEIRHLVTFAGVALPQEIAHDDEEGLVHPELFRASIERNLIGHVNVLWAVQNCLFRSSGDRSIALCSSVNALQSWGEPGYSAAKAGLVGLVRSLAGPYGRRGVRINAITPGTIDTEGSRAEYLNDNERHERMRQTVPLVRDLRHVHGTELRVDGGQTVGRA